MQHRVLIVVILAFLASAATSAFVLALALWDDRGPSDDPAAFVEDIVALVVSDDYESAWPSLNSAHKKVAPRGEYVACELQSPVDSTLDSVKVVRVIDRNLRIPGTTRAVPVKAVTLELGVTSKTFGTHGSFSHTFNAVAEGSHWTWILTPSRYRLYRDDACGVT